MSTKKDKFSLKEKKFMRVAINLAKARKGLTGENPSVGCVLVKNDRILSIGQTGYGGRSGLVGRARGGRGRGRRGAGSCLARRGGRGSDHGPRGR